MIDCSAPPPPTWFDLGSAPVHEVYYVTQEWLKAYTGADLSFCGWTDVRSKPYIAVFVNTPVDICLQRQKLRPGKTIPFNVFNSMVAAVQPPTLDNGFDFVYEVKT